MALEPLGWQKLETDQVSATVTYVGWAQNSFASTSDAVWSILRITQASGVSPNGAGAYEWAPEPYSYGVKWTDRLTLTYTS